MVQRQSSASEVSETWAWSQALRSPSLARYDRAATELALSPRSGATSCGSSPSTSVYQSTDCHRCGRLRNARTVKVRSSAATTGSPSVSGSSNSSRSSVEMSRSGAAPAAREIADRGVQIGAERVIRSAAGQHLPVDHGERLGDQVVRVERGRELARDADARSARDAATTRRTRRGHLREPHESALGQNGLQGHSPGGACRHYGRDAASAEEFCQMHRGGPAPPSERRRRGRRHPAPVPG